MLIILGTRPEVIKMAPVIRELRSRDFEVVVCVTGQHRELLDEALDTFNIVPEHNLRIMLPDQSLVDVTSKVLLGATRVIEREKPDFTVVHGDTTTSLGGALASFYAKVPIAHVEAGLRTNLMHSPFPEEANRVIVDYLSEICFAPTKEAAKNLLRYGIPKKRIFVTGNSVVDALLSILDEGFEFDGLVEGVDLSKAMLVTAHRRENFGRPMARVCGAIAALVARYQDLHVIFSVHPNPNVSFPVRSLLGGEERVHLLAPLGYRAFINILSRCYFVMTDSGGIQEEASAMGKPVLVLRETTERPELVRAGGSRLVGTDIGLIVSEASLLIEDAEHYREMAISRDIYGDGRASKRIVEVLEKALKGPQSLVTLTSSNLARLSSS